MAKKRSHRPEEDDDEENRENGSYEQHEDDDEGEYEEEQNDRRISRKNKKKKKKHKHHQKEDGVMSGSGQTEEERRLLRKRQRELHQVIVMGGGNDNNSNNNNSNAADSDEDEKGNNNDNNGGGLQNLRARNNELWREVKHTREAVLDSENVDLLANMGAREAEKLVQVPRYDAIRLAQSLVKKGSVPGSASASSGPAFNWSAFGFQVGICFNAPPTNVVSFLYGPLDAEYAPKERKKPERRKKSQEEAEESGMEGEEEEPEDVDQTGKKKSDGNELSAVEKHISVIRHTVEDKSKECQLEAQEASQTYASQLSQRTDCDERKVLKKKSQFIREHRQVDAVATLFNPRSFTQTVENIFHFSFLVKENKAGIRNRGLDRAEEFGADPGPVIRPTEQEDGAKVPDPTQAIVSLTMKDWRDMCTAYEVQESHVPHRVHGKVAKEERKKKKSRKSH